MRDGQAIWHPSPNFGERRGGLKPALIVLHYTAMASAGAARDWLCNPEAEVSAHYVIARDGALWQLVEEDQRAWHAGIGAWRGVDDINSRSVGIEIANTGTEPFPAPQMAALEGLMGRVMDRWRLGPRDVVGHSDFAIGRKIDPGPHFDWARLARLGLAEPGGGGAVPETADWPAFRAAARAQGFTFEASDGALLQAVRLRFRPWGQGALAREDFAALPASAGV